MSGMMDRIRDEMAANPKDEMLQMIGEHLTAYVQENPGTAFREGATIKGAMKAMMEKARKQAVGGMAAVSFTDGMKTVYEHMGLIWDAKACMALQLSMYDSAAPLKPEVKAETKTHADAFDLDMLLEGL